MLYPDKLIEIYKDEEKVSSAILISEAICGWWATEGGVTLIKNLILASWAYDLANEDYQKLINGFPIKLSYIDGELKYEDFLYILLKNLKIKKLIDLKLSKLF